jgi:hypothetical protein
MDEHTVAYFADRPGGRVFLKVSSFAVSSPSYFEDSGLSIRKRFPEKQKILPASVS